MAPSRLGTMNGDDGRALVLPPSVRWAGRLGLAEGLVGFGTGVAMIVRDLQGVDTPGLNGVATGIWFLFFGGVVALAGWFLSQGRRWGRGPVAMLQLFLVLVSVFMFSSGNIQAGIPTALVGIVGLGLLFNHDAVDWSAQRHLR